MAADRVQFREGDRGKVQLMESILKTNKKGRTFLRVFYSGDIIGADRAIEQAISKRGLDRAKITVLAYPMSMKSEQPLSAVSPI